MKTERLLFQVHPPEFSKDFIQADSEVWNPWLVRQKGFLNKTSRVVSKGQVEILIHWASKEDAEKASKKESEMLMVDRLLKARSPGRFNLVQSSFI